MESRGDAPGPKHCFLPNCVEQRQRLAGKIEKISREKAKQEDFLIHEATGEVQVARLRFQYDSEILVNQVLQLVVLPVLQLHSIA
jgi:hypothetical protein